MTANDKPLLQAFFDDSCFEMILSPAPQKLFFLEKSSISLFFRVLQLLINAKF